MDGDGKSRQENRRRSEIMEENLCPKCNKSLEVGEWPFCPHGPSNWGVIGDECDVWIKHGICNPDGTPKRYRSKADMREAAFNAGLVQGGDTPRRNARLEDAQALAAERKHAK
jgi:hypothetical protein